tara:strand:- start:37 stop:414 length:378 start_codon:yes stop_codon:yes gene_type:complete
MDEYSSTITEEDFKILEKIAGVYESLPPESVALILAQKKELLSIKDTDDLDMQNQVLISVVDNLPEKFEDRLVFYLAHGILEMIEDNFEDLIEFGKDRIESMEKKEKLESSNTVIKLSDHVKRFK